MENFKGALMAKHTKKPWHTDGFYIWTENMGMVADNLCIAGEYDDLGEGKIPIARARGVGRGLTDDQMAENMHEICRAINAHDDLVVACRAALSTLRDEDVFAPMALEKLLIDALKEEL
jgi:hypothetical protein